MKSVKGYAIEETRKDYLIVFRHGNKTVKTFRYTDKSKGKWRDPIRDPLYWKENTQERPTIPRSNKGLTLYLDDYQEPVLWDAMHVLENFIIVTYG